MRKIQLLDGGLGQEIFRRSGKPAHPLWSTKVMMDQPEIVKEVHQDFLRAGARILTINSYTCTPTRLARDGQLEWFERLQEQACCIARDAVDESQVPSDEVRIAGCLPPLVGSYARDERTFQTLKSEYQQIAAVQAPWVDIMLIETISHSKEACAAIEAVLENGKKAILSFTLSDEKPGELRSGETLEAALAVVANYPLEAVLLNCSFPETISQGLDILRKYPFAFGGYANGFTSVDALQPGGTVAELSARTDLDEEAHTAFVMDWIQKGASFVGGCCEISPAHIRHLRNRMVNEGYDISAGQAVEHRIVSHKTADGNL
ncbi:MAG: homocysteine S-methyltransferase [Bacteroidetes bacterium]|jgi:S-methylmethionine-dependent homocysteine/selenocysteine methylase|nr:homocysteine S-methyltransferase [Bacteroidota bacterium]